MCACVCSTKALESCNSVKPRLQAQVTFLYWRFRGGNELRGSRALGKAQRPKGCVLSGDLKPCTSPEKTEVREVPTVTQLRRCTAARTSTESAGKYFCSTLFFFAREKWDFQKV